MLKELLENKRFLEITDEFLKCSEVIDIILLGSIMRGKFKPKDVDMLIIYLQDKKQNINMTYELRKKLEKILKNIQIISKAYSNIFKPEFLARESLLSEGFSLRLKKFISRSLGYANFVLFRYSLKKMSNSKRMLFYYALYGREKNDGILAKNKCIKFSDTIILSPIENSEVIKDFLKKNSIEYIDIPILIPERTLNAL